MKPLYVLKIGGSCLTYKKEKISKVRYFFLKRLIEEIKTAQKEKNFSLVIVHGGGSVVHPLIDYFNMAKKIKSGNICSKEDKISSAKIHLAMNKLNNIVAEKFLEKDLSVWPMQTSASSNSCDGDVINFNLTATMKALKKGFIPIFHGDLNFDKTMGISICSGDLAACFLAKKLKASKIFFASDVDGVYDKDPFLFKNSKRIREIRKNILIESFKQKKEFDHSGGMFSKLVYISKYCKGIEVIIFNGLVKNSFLNLLKGYPSGTSIKL